MKGIKQTAAANSSRTLTSSQPCIKPIPREVICAAARKDTPVAPLPNRRSALQQMVAVAATSLLTSNLDVHINPSTPTTPLFVSFHPASAAAAEGLRYPTSVEKAALDKALKKAIVPTKCAVALRLVFHDAGTFDKASGDGGLNASIQFELGRPESFGLKRGWNIIGQVKMDLMGTPAEGIVSCSDLIVLAGAMSVEKCGGPSIPLMIGRPDATEADPEDRMPPETLSAEQLKENFAAKGLSVREMIVLSGAHTIGGKGFGDPVTFDNQYFKSLLDRPWNNKNDNMASMIGLPSDRVLPEDPECEPIIQEYAKDQDLFFKDFSAAYIKMASLGVKEAL